MHFTPAPLVDVKTYAEHRGVTTRTVMAWLSADRLPDAVKLEGRWSIPIDAEPIGSQTVARRAETPTDVVVIPEPAPVRTRRRPVPVAVLAAEWGVPTETVRRWARNGEGGLSMSTGPQRAHYIWVEML